MELNGLNDQTKLFKGFRQLQSQWQLAEVHEDKPSRLIIYTQSKMQFNMIIRNMKVDYEQPKLNG